MVRSLISHDRQQLGTWMCYRATWETAVLRANECLKRQAQAMHTQSIAKTLNQPFQSQENRHVPSFRISDTTSTHPPEEKQNFEVILELYADSKELLTIRLPF